MLEILRQLRKGTRSFFVFSGSGRTGHLVEPKKGWKRLLARAGLKDLRIHDLRRTMGSWQAKTGASLAIIGKSLNHKNQSTTAIYARLDIDPACVRMEKATAAMLEAARQEKNR
jgi:integrase